jgi:tetratricopeptide (TPR) repeat protein
MTTAPANLVDALADRYRLERELGHGGMATVYLAHDLKHDRSVAVKALHPELAHALGPERFLREITITAQFDHPYILPLLDSGVVEPQTSTGRRLLYYVMPYVDGESLRDRMNRQKQLPVDDAIQITREVAEALGYAHARGVIHRDIKPENIMLSGGHARVADFGIARAIDVAGSERLTETGLAIGTPAYMSPEQSMAERDVDGRSDLYALGSVLYEMLVGEPPYTGPTAHAILAKRMTNPVPSVRTIRETVPASVDRALSRALAKAPADRFPTATQFAEALGDSATTAPVAMGSGDRRMLTWLVGVITLLALALLGGWLFARSRRSPVVPSASIIAVLPFLPSTADTALARLGRDLVLTVSANLDGVGGIRTADPRLVLSAADDRRSRGTADAIALGKNLGAGSVVVGNIVREGPEVRLDLKLLATSGDSQPLARATITSAPDSIGALTDSVTWALLRQVWRGGEPPSPSYENLTTRSVESLRAFLAGEQFTIAGRWSEAIEAYASAIKADSSFWLAGWRYNWAEGWVLEGKFNPDLQRGYESHLSAFGERDRMLIEADMTGDSVLFVDYLARTRAIVTRFPNDWSAWSKYADVLHHWGPMIGVTNSEMRAALQRTVDLNPRLVPYLEHLLTASLGHDSAQAAKVAEALTALGYYSRLSAERGYDASMGARLELSAGAGLPVSLRDSFALAIARSPDWLVRTFASVRLYAVGYPAAQIELNRRLLALAPHDSLAGFTWVGTAQAWAARGAWDSTLAAYQHAVSLGTRNISPVSLYTMAASGTWLGALDMARTAEQRAAAVKSLDRLPPGEPATRRERAMLAWADGILAAQRRNLPDLKEARERLRQSGASAAPFMERSLAGFELELRGARQAAAESLAVLDLAATDLDISAPHDPYARSITHLAASQLMLEQGDTSRALKLLRWHEAYIPASAEGFRSQIFAGLAYYQLARIEKAQGKDDLAREHYEQFLRRYDMPPPAHRHLVDEAKGALRRMSRQKDTPATN